MAATPTATERPLRLGPPGWARARPYAAVVVLGGAAAVALAEVLGSVAPPPALLIAVGGIGALAVLALALARYETTVVLGVALIAVVKVEPAPADAILLVAMLVAVVTGRFDLARAPTTMVICVSALLALSAISTVEAIDRHRAYEFLAITVYLGLFVLWFSTYVDSTRRARAVLLAYVGAAVVAAALGTLALVAPIPGRATLLYHGCCRAEGFFKDPNVFGPFLIPAVVLLLEEVLAPRLLSGRRAVKLAGLAILTLGVLVSYSRAAWLNLAVAVVILLVVHAMRRGGARAALDLLLVVALLACAGAAYLSLSGSEGFLRERAGLQSYDTERFATQKAGLALAVEHPLGIGPGQFDIREPISSHNTYVRVLAEQGVLGFAALLGLLLGTLAFAVANAAAGRSTYGIGSAALLAAWCGLLANSFFIDTLHWRHLWFVAALVWAATMLRYRSRGT
jgi:O-antigen ligase